MFILPSITEKTFAQSPYELSWKKDGLIFGLEIPFAYLGVMVDQSISPLTENELETLRVQEVNSLDRFATKNYSKQAAHLSDILLYTCILSPLTFLLSKNIRGDLGTVFGMHTESLILSLFIPTYSKIAFGRVRPYAYNPDVPMDQRLSSDARKSFFSGHTSIAFGSMVFVSTVYSGYFPDSKWRPYVWGGTLLLASTVGYLRIAAGSHFLTDVIAGAIVGSAVGYIIPKIHKVDNKYNSMQYPDAQFRKPIFSIRFNL
jgi:membrane-associated phospholipid phosphatase